jgi:hypothetical protein
VYDGCKELDQKGCTQEKLDKYLNGLETGHHAMLAMVCLNTMYYILLYTIY